MITAILARRRIMMAKQSRKAPDMVLLINSTNTGDFSVTTNYGTFTAVKVSEYPYFGTTVTHKLSISGVTFSTGEQISNVANVRWLFVGVESWGTSNTYTNASRIFNGCSNIRSCGTIFTALAQATNVTYLFGNCTGMQGDIHALYVYLSTKPIAVSAFSRCFSGCTQAIGYGSIPASWK